MPLYSRCIEILHAACSFKRDSKNRIQFGMTALAQKSKEKVWNFLDAQRRSGTNCDVVLQLDIEDEASGTTSMEECEVFGHFCVIGPQSEFIGVAQPDQISIGNPLRVVLKSFTCSICLQAMMEYFYDDVASVSKDHEPHFHKLANILRVTELLELFETEEEAVEQGGLHIPEDNSTIANILQRKPNYFKLKNPRATASNSKINYCHGCDYKCYRVQEMLNHMRGCAGSQLTCSLCEVGFTVWQEYEAHLRKHSTDVKKPFFCLECGVRFMTRTALMVHYPKHSTDAPHLCSHCGKKFKWIQGLRSHQLIHNKEKKMLCDVCGYSTTGLKALKSHKLQHTGELFKCTFPGCGHRANRKENLKLHIETHKQEQPFVCEVCGSKFSLSKNLKRHALKHTGNNTGDKNYKCQLCSYCSHRSDKLREHVQRVHTEKAVQLELPETVENSFENKLSDDEFNLPEVLDGEAPAKLSIQDTGEARTTQKKPAAKTPPTPVAERRVRPLAPKPPS